MGEVLSPGASAEHTPSPEELAIHSAMEGLRDGMLADTPIITVAGSRQSSDAQGYQLLELTYSVGLDFPPLEGNQAAAAFAEQATAEWQKLAASGQVRGTT